MVLKVETFDAALVSGSGLNSQVGFIENEGEVVLGPAVRTSPGVEGRNFRCPRCLSMGLSGLPWASLGISGLLQPSLGLYGPLWASLGLSGSLWPLSQATDTHP